MRSAHETETRARRAMPSMTIASSEGILRASGRHSTPCAFFFFSSSARRASARPSLRQRLYCDCDTQRCAPFLLLSLRTPRLRPLLSTTTTVLRLRRLRPCAFSSFPPRTPHLRSLSLSMTDYDRPSCDRALVGPVSTPLRPPPLRGRHNTPPLHGSSRQVALVPPTAVDLVATAAAAAAESDVGFPNRSVEMMRWHIRIASLRN